MSKKEWSGTWDKEFEIKIIKQLVMFITHHNIIHGFFFKSQKKRKKLQLHGKETP